MSKNTNRRARLIRELLRTTDQELCDEDLIHMLISEEFSAAPDNAENASLGQRAADAVAKFAGSWTFIFTFLGTMTAWMILNVLLAEHAFDGYPFILLNLVLSCVAAVQAPLIMMSQNRQEEKDRKRAESDYRINLKSELIIDDLHVKLDQILANQKRLEHELDLLKSSDQKDIPSA